MTKYLSLYVINLRYNNLYNENIELSKKVFQYFLEGRHHLPQDIILKLKQYNRKLEILKKKIQQILNFNDAILNLSKDFKWSNKHKIYVLKFDQSVIDDTEEEDNCPIVLKKLYINQNTRKKYIIGLMFTRDILENYIGLIQNLKFKNFD